MDLDARRQQLLARLKELQGSAMQLDQALAQTRTQIERVIGALEVIGEQQQELAKLPDAVAPAQRER